MKSRDIQIGCIYAAKVSSQIVPVKVMAIDEVSSFGCWTTRYRCRNLRTGRDITVKSPQRFRYPTDAEPQPVQVYGILVGDTP